MILVHGNAAQAVKYCRRDACAARRALTFIIIASACIAFTRIAPLAQADAPTVRQRYKGLTGGPLDQARLVALPKGTLVRATGFTLTQAQLKAEIGKLSAQSRAQLKGHEILVVEGMTARSLLKVEAAKWAARSASDSAGKTGDALIQAYLRSVAGSGNVSDAEIKAFYAENREMFGGAPYDSVASGIRGLLSRQKQQETVTKHISGMGSRHRIEVDAAWCASQAKSVFANKVDQARRSGVPALIKFGSKGCAPCDMLTPILADLRKSYQGKCQVIEVQVRDEPILASRYGIQSIPVLAFYNKNGDEVFRHTGYWPKDAIVSKLSELGIR